MKKLFFLVLLISNFLGHAQYTLIPDVNFEKALINLGIDNGPIDGRVLTVNASGITSLDIAANNITNLTGIQDFVSLTFLECSRNKLTSLDVTKNTLLTLLNCWGNNLTSLNTANNHNLTYLSCFQNQLTSLDISQNIILSQLYCSWNQLTSLNLKNGNNKNLFAINANLNPNLKCIEVDNKTYSDTNWSSNKDATARYSEDCNAIITAPTITSTTPASRCNTGTVTLSATTSDGIISWYDVPTGGTPLGTGISFTTPNITTTTKYYVNATVDNYTTPTRTEIIATVNTIPTISSITSASHCDTGTLNLGAISSDGIINWYDVPTGGTSLRTGTSFTTPNITSTKKYYVDASTSYCKTLTRTEIIATINNTPTITSSAPASRCDIGTITLGATASGGIINWYDVSTNGTSLGTGTSFTTSNTANTTKYFIDANANGCITPTRTEITATINTIPTITSTAAASRCDIGSLTLGAVASDGTINWYDVPIGGTSLVTGTSFTTPSITSTTKYYVDASTTDCTTPTRTEIIATVNNIPTITSITPASRCNTGTVTLGAIASNGIVNWYAAPSGGTSLGTGTLFTTPNITNTTKYYVDASTIDCTTPTRTEIIAAVNTTPIITSTTPESRCDTGTVTLGAIASGGNINWYNVPTGGTSLSIGISFTTPNINTTTTFYVETTDNNCPSPRIAVVATVIPIAKKNEEVILCQSETVTLDASISGMNYLWSPGGETTQTIVVSSPGNYSVVTSSAIAICNSKKDINVKEHINAKIKNITVDQNSITIELNNPENYYEFSIDGEFFQDSNQFTHIPNGQYTASVRAKYLCDMVQQDFKIFMIAKYFTPNNDGLNDNWEISEMKNYPNSSAVIFDRYGKLIKHLTPSNPSWDGTYNQRNLPETDYWYIIKLDPNSPELRGHFALRR